MINRSLILRFIYAILILTVTGCSRDSISNETNATVTESIIELSKPDEALNMLKREISVDLWSDYLSVYSSSSDTRTDISFIIGRNITNAILSVYLGDYETAEDIVKEIKLSSETLNIKSATVEALVVKLKEDLDIDDEVLRAKVVKQTVNLLQDSILLTLNEMGSEGDITYIEFGVWLEAVLITSRLVSENYSDNVSSVLNRNAELNYFIEKYTGLDNAVVDFLKVNREAFTSNENKIIENSKILKFLDSTKNLELLNIGVK